MEAARDFHHWPTTGTFVDIDVPGGKCLEWNRWLIRVLGRRSGTLPDLSGVEKKVLFEN